MEKQNSILPAITISLGLVIAGYFIGNGIYKTKTHDRYVTVKGLAERDVDADLVIWPISFGEPSNNLPDLENALRVKTNTVRSFLMAAGFDAEEISLGVASITDFQAIEYYNSESKQFRYLGKGRITVNTDKVDLIMLTMSRITELAGQGIVVSGETYDNRVQFLFTKLNDIKPAMIEEATVNAREAAVKFADDSGSELGKIRRADQGLFTISDRDLNSPHKKKVRVVSTIQYLLSE